MTRCGRDTPHRGAFTPRGPLGPSAQRHGKAPYRRWVRLRFGRHLCAFAVTAVALLAGVWLMMAPWVLWYPRPAGGWGAPTLIDFWTGVAVVTLSGVTALLYAAALRDALRCACLVPGHTRGSRRQRRAGRRSLRVADVPSPPPDAPNAGSDLISEIREASGSGRVSPPAVAGRNEDAVLPVRVDDVLVPLATALLADLARRRMADAGDGAGTAEERSR